MGEAVRTMATFRFPEIQFNETGWGPTKGVDPEKFQNIPYAPFGKGDRLGRAADWSGSARPARFYGGQGNVTGAFGYNHDGQDETFQLVDNKPAQRPQHFGPRRHWPTNGRRDWQRNRKDTANQLNAGAQRSVQREIDQDRRRNNKRFGKNDNRWDQNRVQQRSREASVDVRADWHVLEQLNFPLLQKLKASEPAGEDIVVAGHLYQYDKIAEKCSAKNGRLLQRQEQTAFYNVTTSEDPVIERLLAETDAQVFATDQVLSVLMAAPRSVYSWDVVVTKRDGKIFFDKRDNSSIDFLSVNETANETPASDTSINSAASLAQEATCINQNITQQLMHKNAEPTTFDEPHPFVSDDEVAAADAYINVRALNEYDSRLSSAGDWRNKLDSQKGAVLAAELKNNSAKLARWTAQSVLADAGIIKLGFVSRVHPRDQYNHTILNMQSFKTTEMIQQTNLNMENGWGIVKAFVDLIIRQEDGKFVILKDPNKSLLRIYTVPPNCFEEADEDELAPVVGVNAFD